MDCCNEQCGSHDVDINGQPLAAVSARSAARNPYLSKLQMFQDTINGGTAEEKKRAHRRLAQLMTKLQTEANDMMKPEQSARAREALAIFLRDQQLELQKRDWEKQRKDFEELQAKRPRIDAVEANFTTWNLAWQQWQSWEKGIRASPILQLGILHGNSGSLGKRESA